MKKRKRNYLQKLKQNSLCLVRQLMQSVNCELARQLKNVLVDLTRDVVVH